tara:strand:+ start:141 stop:443 length:303 start_codon:yes stop_codon:yes gene_type:complete
VEFTNLLLILILLIVFLVPLFLIFFYPKLKNRSTKKLISFPQINNIKEKQDNPDLNTNNWDLHKFRLKKFKRSQYKGLTFFVSSENRIYYLSEEGNRVYC